jgi:hypothetical protein
MFYTKTLKKHARNLNKPIYDLKIEKKKAKNYQKNPKSHNFPSLNLIFHQDKSQKPQPLNLLH